MAAAVKTTSPRNEFACSDSDDRDSILSGSINFSVDLQHRLKEVESEKLNLMINHNNLIKEFNKRMESHLEEIHVLKNSNQGLQSEMQELRDLCCYLDDDRQKCRKLAKEWQRFGKYTVAVMRNEVMSYQDKLETLEGRQVELIKENGELRDICVYLDSQRTGETTDNDEDIKNSLFKYVVCEKCQILRSPSSDAWSADGESRVDKLRVESAVNHEDGLPSYTKCLEERVQQLEEEKDKLNTALSNKKAKKRVSFLFPDDDGDSSTSEQDRYDTYQNGHYKPLEMKDLRNNGVQGILRNGFKSNHKEIPPPPISPESMLHTDSMSQAMKVLEIQEKLERASLDSGSTETLSENETAILKEMCNVVWKKLSNETSASPPPYNPPISTNRRTASLLKTNGNNNVAKKVLEDLC